VSSAAYGCESSASTTSFTTIQSCDVPSNISVNTTSSTATINWDALGNADGYELLYNAPGAGWQSITVTTNSYVMDISPGSIYSFYIRTVCDSDSDFTSDWSGLEVFSVVCETPTDFEITATNGDVTFVWNGTASSYKLVYTVGVGYVVVYPNTTTYTVSGVSGGTEVTAYLWSVCDAETNFMSGWVTDNFTTPSSSKSGEMNIVDLEVYPNPTRDELNISFVSEELQSISVRMVDAYGKEVFSQADRQFIGEYTQKVSVSRFAKGVYFFQIVTENNILHERIIVQ
jgi:hypothetical protein